MTAWAWQLWLCMPLVYLGAFLSGIRPARWFGTRLMPLVAAGFRDISHRDGSVVVADRRRAGHLCSNDRREHFLLCRTA